MIEISESIRIDENELTFSFVRSSGPGGQNVNKVATTAQLRFDVENSLSLPPEVKERLRKVAGRRMTEEGILIIQARRYRSQERNRQDVIDRFATLVKRALERPKPRKKTRPSSASRERRLEDKHRRSKVKSLRKPPHEE